MLKGDILFFAAMKSRTSPFRPLSPFPAPAHASHRKVLRRSLLLPRVEKGMSPMPGQKREKGTFYFSLRVA
jgi:hypothetical protein